MNLSKLRDKDGIIHVYKNSHQYTVCGKKSTEIRKDWYPVEPADCGLCRALLYKEAIDEIDEVFLLDTYGNLVEAV